MGWNNKIEKYKLWKIQNNKFYNKNVDVSDNLLLKTSFQQSNRFDVNTVYIIIKVKTKLTMGYIF